MFIFLLFMNSIVPLMMIGFGYLWKSHPPQGVNWIYGYRTSMSMKNNETWKFAHEHNSKIWGQLGSIWLVISVILMFIFKNNYESASTWINYIGLAIIIGSLIPTEIALRKRFDKDGNLK